MYRFICLKFINIEKQFKTFSLDGPWAILDEYYYKTYCSCSYDAFIFIISNFISVRLILWFLSGKRNYFLLNKFFFVFIEGGNVRLSILIWLRSITQIIIKVYQLIAIVNTFISE